MKADIHKECSIDRNKDCSPHRCMLWEHITANEGRCLIREALIKYISAGSMYSFPPEQ